MSEETDVILPEDWEEGGQDFPLVAEGPYAVMVDKVTQPEKDRVLVDFVVLDDGPFAKRHLFQSFLLTTEGGKHAFTQFLDAIGVAPKGCRLNRAACARKLLRVTVKHNERDGKVYANVVRCTKAEG